MEVGVANTVDWAARPKIYQFWLFKLINHDILRLNVTMTDVIRAQPIHSSDYAIDKSKFLTEREQLALIEEQLTKIEGIWIHNNGNVFSVFGTVPVISRHIATTTFFYVKNEVQLILE